MEGWSVTSKKYCPVVTASVNLNRMVSRLENIVMCAWAWRHVVVIWRCGRNLCFLGEERTNG